MPSPPLAVAAAIHRALSGMATALEAIRLEDFLGHAVELNGALAEAGTTTCVTDADRAALTRELAAARVALRRCDRLGLSLNDLVQMTTTPQGLSGGYGRDGQRSLMACAAAVEARG